MMTTARYFTIINTSFSTSANLSGRKLLAVELSVATAGAANAQAYWSLSSDATLGVGVGGGQEGDGILAWINTASAASTESIYIPMPKPIKIASRVYLHASTSGAGVSTYFAGILYFE